MKLTELDPQFTHLGAPGHHRHVDTLAEADAVSFDCPACPPWRTHRVGVFFRGRGVPADEVPGPGRWEASGTGLDDLTLRPSIALDCWHGFVTAGVVTS